MHIMSCIEMRPRQPGRACLRRLRTRGRRAGKRLRAGLPRVGWDKRSAACPRPPGARAMPRAARKYQWAESAAYHVINRGHNRESVFGDEEESAYFLTLLARY